MDNPVSVILFSADAEWQAAQPWLPAGDSIRTPYGGAIVAETILNDRPATVVYLQGGWGKIAAAASAQYAIDRWRPALVVNLGTCGGFAGDITPGSIMLVDFTLVYDIMEKMGDAEAALAHYATEIDLSWLPRHLPQPVTRGMLISADRDIVPAEIQELRERYGAVAADWESGAIAYVAARNGVRCLILRGVSDVVSADGGEVYGDLTLFESRTAAVMADLLGALPAWLQVALPTQGA